MDEKLTPIQQLDEVLLSLSQDRGHSDLEGVVALVKRITKHEYPYDKMLKILGKLCKDGYVNMESTSIGIAPFTRRNYSISFEGEYFITQLGGYQTKSVLDDAENIRLKALESSQHGLGQKLNVLTGWIAGGTIVLALIELAKWFEENHWWPF